MMESACSNTPFEKVNEDPVLADDLVKKNHTCSGMVGKNGSNSNMISFTGKKRTQLMRKIERIKLHIYYNKRAIKHAQQSIETIKKRNPNSKRIQQIQDNEIAVLAQKNDYCRAKIARIIEHLSD